MPCAHTLTHTQSVYSIQWFYMRKLQLFLFSGLAWLSLTRLSQRVATAVNWLAGQDGCCVWGVIVIAKTPTHAHVSLMYRWQACVHRARSCTSPACAFFYLHQTKHPACAVKLLKSSHLLIPLLKVCGLSGRCFLSHSPCMCMCVCTQNRLAFVFLGPFKLTQGTLSDLSAYVRIYFAICSSYVKV